MRAFDLLSKAARQGNPQIGDAARPDVSLRTGCGRRSNRELCVVRSRSSRGPRLCQNRAKAAFASMPSSDRDKGAARATAILKEMKIGQRQPRNPKSRRKGRCCSMRPEQERRRRNLSFVLSSRRPVMGVARPNYSRRGPARILASRYRSEFARLNSSMSQSPDAKPVKPPDAHRLSSLPGVCRRVNRS